MTNKLFTTILSSCLLMTGIAQSHAQGVMTTAIGNGTYGNAGDGGPASAAFIGNPNDVCLDAAGNVYFVDYAFNVVRKVTKATGIITRIAGTDTMGYGGDGAPAVNATLNAPQYLCIDNSGNLYISDVGNNIVRKIDATTGIITTVVGIPGNPSVLTTPMGIRIDDAGNLYTVDNFNNVILKRTSDGSLTTIAGTGVGGYTGDGGLATLAQLNAPVAIAINHAGDVFFSDQGAAYIRKISAATGIITTIAGNGLGFSGDGGPAIAAGLGSVYGMCLDDHGDIYIDDVSCSSRKIDMATGLIHVIAGDGVSSGYNGDGGTATAELLDVPMGLCVDPSNGNVLIADNDNSRIRMATQPDYVTTAVKHVNMVTASVYPNPSTGRFLVTVTEDQKPATVIVTNAAGDLLYTTTLTASQTTIDLAQQAAGMYFMTMKNINGSNTQKIIIEK